MQHFGLVRLEIDHKLVGSVLAADHEVVFYVSAILDHERSLAWLQARRHVNLVVRQGDVNAPRVWIGCHRIDHFVDDFFGALNYFVSDIFGCLGCVLCDVFCLFDRTLRPDNTNGESDRDDS